LSVRYSYQMQNRTLKWMAGFLVSALCTWLLVFVVKYYDHQPADRWSEDLYLKVICLILTPLAGFLSIVCLIMTLVSQFTRNKPEEDLPNQTPEPTSSTSSWQAASTSHALRRASSQQAPTTVTPAPAGKPPADLSRRSESKADAEDRASGTRGSS
jgi:hypothetical protein